MNHLNANSKLGYEKYDLSNYNIKPEFNTKWYTNNDRYSEGDIEDAIIKLILDSDIEDYEQIIYDNFGWSSYYHLTHVRKNILNWYPFSKEGTVLEIGCGLGAITNMLCEKCKKVTAVELSKRRATAAALRCRDKENLEIIVGNLNDIEFEEKFDYITLIGVLEYQGTYTDSSNPYVDFIKKIKSFLKPQGKLLIAIENKFGLKYWCGAREDHTGIPFDSINNYEIGGKQARTFSKQELSDIVRDSGFENSYFYYPFPDYKLPTVIYSQDYLPKDGLMDSAATYYTPNTKSLVANEKKLYNDLIDNQVFEFFANSFLVECSDDAENMGEVIFATLASSRQKEYRVGTRIKKDYRVEKFSLVSKLENLQHIQQICDNMDALSTRNIGTIPFALQDGMIQMDYINSPTMAEVLSKEYKSHNVEQIWDWYQKLWDVIENSSEEIKKDSNIIFELGIDIPENNINYGKILNVGYLDLIPRNCFVTEAGLAWFDQEWKLDKVPVKFLFYRAVHYTYFTYPWMESIVKFSDVCKKFEITECVNTFLMLEQLFLNIVFDMVHGACAGSLSKVDGSMYVQSINKLL